MIREKDDIEWVNAASAIPSPPHIDLPDGRRLLIRNWRTDCGVDSPLVVSLDAFVETPNPVSSVPSVVK